MREPLPRVRERAAARPTALPWAHRLRRADGAPRVIAEFKRASPSAGAFPGTFDPAQRARLYAEAGAAAMSVLTDVAFDGELADLEAAAAAESAIPLLRKDFLVDPWQAWESRAAGADAVLLLVAGLADTELEAVASAARDAGLGLLVELHARAEIDRALAIDPAVVGVNARDLTSLDVSVPRMLEILGEVRVRAGESTVLVAESGITGPDDALRAAAAGADAILVGEHLMRSDDPRGALADLTTIGEARVP